MNSVVHVGSDLARFRGGSHLGWATLYVVTTVNGVLIVATNLKFFPFSKNQDETCY